MDFLSKLLKNSKIEKAAKSILNGLAESASAPSSVQPGRPESSAPASGASTWSQAEKARGYGTWWGPVMPSEPNQYNYPGYFLEYFENVFREDFPGYRIEREVLTDRPAAVFTFFDGDRKALVVELMSERSSARKLRRLCESAGIPYLRYYYDHEGWWNTRSYVVTRTRRALGI